MTVQPSINPFAAAAQGVALQPGQVAGAPSTLPPQSALPIPAQNTLPATASGMPNGAKPGVEEIDFDADVSAGGLDKFPKMQKDQVARIAFILFNVKADGTQAPRAKKSSSFSFGNFGDPDQVSFIAPEHNAQLMKALVQKSGREPSTKIGTIVLHYETNSAGVLDTSGRFKIEAFMFGAEKFNAIKQHHKEWGLQNHDLLVTCTEPNYQKLTFAVARESLWANAPAELKAEIIAKAEQAFEGSLNRFMGFSRTDADIIQWLQTGQMPKPGNNRPQPAGGPIAPNPNNPFGQGTPQIAVSPTTIAQQAGVGQGQAAAFADLVASETQQPQQTVQQPVAEQTVQPTVQVQPQTVQQTVAPATAPTLNLAQPA